MHKRAPLLRPRKRQNETVPSHQQEHSSLFIQHGSKNNISLQSKRSSRKLSIISLVVTLFFILISVTFVFDKLEHKSHDVNDVLKKDDTTISATNIIQKTTILNKNAQNMKHDNKAKDSKNVNDEPYSANYHLIFSTDCSAYQHWQSYLMFHSAYKVNQPGTITRIASGCSDKESKEAIEWHEQHVTNIMGERFKLHLTPHFSGVKDADGNTVGDYKFFNKPFGLLHWLEHSETIGFQEGSTKVLNNLDDVVILIDPDMILLRPITGDFSNPDDVVVGKMHERERKYYVKHGSPFAQTYGFGTQWKKKLDLSIIAGPQSPALDVSFSDGNSFYPVGPPYLATVKDMYQIAIKWSEFVPGVHKQYPHLLAEMFAYCAAAAHLGLKHQVLDSLMVSNVYASGEGWPLVDRITKDKVSSLCEYASQPDHSDHPVPSVIHFCQHYAIGDWFFGKRAMVKDFFECESPLMEFPPLNIIETSDYRQVHGKRTEPSEKNLRREGFVTCGILGSLNDASIFFKENSCKDTRANMEKTTNLNK